MGQLEVHFVSEKSMDKDEQIFRSENEGSYQELLGPKNLGSTRPTQYYSENGLTVTVRDDFTIHGTSFPVIFRFISGEISAQFFWDIFIAPKDSSLNFRGYLFSYFWAIVLMSAVISILEDFGSPLPARTVTVKGQIGLRR